MKLIDKDALVAEIDRLKKEDGNPYFPSETADKYYARGVHFTCDGLINFLDTLEVKDVDLIIHTVIAECCDWLAMTTNLSHDEIESCRNLMLNVKEEQYKAQKGEKYDCRR